MKTRTKLMLTAFLGVLAWKVCRMDWIVQCDYEWLDTDPPVSVHRGIESYYPKVAAMWNPPTPAAITGRASATWNDYEFFVAGGAYGPISAATLHIHWKLLLLKVGGILLPLYLLILALVEDLNSVPCPSSRVRTRR
jgi:hypothetical protein